MYYVSSLSFGKDSLAMTLRLVEEHKPLNECVFFHMGEPEFSCMETLAEKMRGYLADKGIKLTVLYPTESFTYLATKKEFLSREGFPKKGLQWCGGRCRWGTAIKCQSIERYLRSLGEPEITQYVGIAADESIRADRAISNRRSHYPKEYPLIEWGMTEADCLAYCRERGWSWSEWSETAQDFVDLYDILDRVSCWCCRNKNLKELYNVYRFLPDYWQKLENLQQKLTMPYRRDGKTVFDLKERFARQAEQTDLFDVFMGSGNKG